MHIYYKKLSICALTILTVYTFPAQKINTSKVSFTQAKTPSARTKRKQKIPKTKKSHKVITDMNYQELLDAKERYKAAKNINGYTKALELLLKLATDTTALAEHMIELADAYYEQGKYKKAALIYNEFILFYKGHDKIEYAHFKAIQSLEQLLLPADRDQTRTEEIIELVENYLAQQEFVEYRDQVIVLQKKCHELLFESKKNTCKFYLTYNNTIAAKRSIERLRDEWQTLLPEKEKDMLLLEIALAEKTNNEELQQEKELLLTAQFPEENIVVADTANRRSMRDRF